MIRTRHDRRQRIGIALAVAGMMIAVSCASGDDADDADDGNANAAADGEAVDDSAAATTKVTPTDSTVGPDLATWANGVTTAWADLLQSRAEAAAAAIAAVGAGATRVERTQPFYDAEIAAFDAFLAAVPPSTGDPTLDEPLDELVAAAAAVRDAAAAGRDVGAADPTAAQAQLDEAGDAGLPDTEYGAAFIAYGELEGPLIDACFALQDAMIAADLQFVDCTGSGVDVELATESATEGLDPTVTATGSATQVELGPGTHVFDVFEAGLTVEMTEPRLVSSSVDHVGFRPVEGAPVDVVVTDPGGVVVAGSVQGDPGLLEYTDELPDDMASWLAELPVTIVDEGTMAVGGAEMAYWEIEAADPAGGEFVSLAYFDGSPETGSFAGVGLPPFPGARLTLVEWTRADDRLLIHWLLEGDPGSEVPDETAGFIDAVLASIVADAPEPVVED